MRMLALAGVVCTAVIIATGAAVRLSESGLGCPDWPACTRGSLVAARSAGGPMGHSWIEVGNRPVTVAVTPLALVGVVAAWRVPPRGPRGRAGGRRRRDVVWLAAAQPAGILAQAVLGGVVVLTDLNPGMVALHFVASIAVLGAAVALHVRCTEGQAPARPLVRTDLRLLAYAVLAVGALMLAAGTGGPGTRPPARAGAGPRVHPPRRGRGPVPRGHRLAAGRAGRRARGGTAADPRPRWCRPARLGAAGDDRRAGRGRVHPVLHRAAGRPGLGARLRGDADLDPGAAPGVRA